MLDTTALPRKATLSPPLDTRYQVETPEGIDLPLRPAGLMVRALAFSIDLALRGLILGLLFVALAMLGKLGAGLGSILLFAVSWWYMVLFEVFNQGCSPGKQWMGLRVIQDDGTPVGWSASLLRNLLRSVDMLPFGYGAGLVASLADPWSRRLGDMVAGTLVIHAPRDRTRIDALQAAPLAPAVPLQTQEQLAVIAFAERAHLLTDARRQELGDIVAPVSGGRGEVGVRRLLGIANWLLGRRA